MIFFEQARAQAEAAYGANNQDAAVRSGSSFCMQHALQPLEHIGSLHLRHSKVGWVYMLQALTRWGGALLELAHFKQGGEASEMINEVGNMAGMMAAAVRSTSPRAAAQQSAACQAAKFDCALQTSAALCMLSSRLQQTRL